LQAKTLKSFYMVSRVGERSAMRKLSFVIMRCIKDQHK